MRPTSLAVPFAVLLVSLGHAEAAPPFCAAIGDARVVAVGDVARIVADENPRFALLNIVGRICRPDDDARAHMAELEAARQRWSARLGLIDADWGDIAVYATEDGQRRAGSVHLAEEPGAPRRPWSAFDAVDQYVYVATPQGGNELLKDMNYLVDALGPKLSEAGRLAYVRRCIDGTLPVQWAMCQGDIEKLDLAKLGAELRANRAYDGQAKTEIRIVAAETRERLAAHAERVKKLVAGDPGYAKLFEIAATARKQWDERAARAAPLLELALQMDDARNLRSRSAFAGCEARTWAAFKSAVAAIPAKQFEGMNDDRKLLHEIFAAATTPIIGDPDAYLAAIAFVTCMDGQEPDTRKDALVRLVGDALVSWPGTRGPRTSAETAMLAAGVVLDDRDARLEFPREQRPFGPGALGRDTDGTVGGVVASLTPGARKTTVSFKPQMVRQVQCAETRQTGKVVQILPDGTFVYQVICLRNETVTVNKAAQPVEVNPRYLEGVKPGMYVTITEDVLIAAYPKPGATIPAMVFGVAVR